MKKKLIVGLSFTGILIGWLHPDWRLSAAGYPSTSSSSSESTQKSILDQQSNQIVRQISNMISNRIFSDLFPSDSYSNNDIPKGASGDAESRMPDSLWSNAAWSGLSSNGSANGSYNADIYQYIIGIDKKIGNFYFGTAANYAGVTNHLQPTGSTGFNGSSQTGGLAPYVAYTFTKNFFISGLAGYNYTAISNNGSAPDSQMNSVMTEFDLNGIKIIGNWFMKGKTGARYLHTYTSTDAFLAGTIPTSRGNQGRWTYLLDLEGGYSFKNGLRIYNGILYENLSQSSGIQNGISYTLGNNIFYYSAGADYQVNKKFTLGTKVQTDLNNNTSNLTTVGLNLRYLFE